MIQYRIDAVNLPFTCGESFQNKVESSRTCKFWLKVRYSRIIFPAIMRSVVSTRRRFDPFSILVSDGMVYLYARLRGAGILIKETRPAEALASGRCATYELPIASDLIPAEGGGLDYI